MYKETIGVVGGFGGYATLSFFQRLLKEFSMGCERDIPHIYMDNDFSMPSRTRALLTGECYDEVVMKIAKSLKGLCISGGADYIVLPCGTAHAFLPDVYRIVPEAEEKVLHIVKLLGNTLEEAGVEETLILAAEGLLKKKLYPRWLSKIKCVNPSEEYYTDIRFFIECVKQDKMDKNCLKKFVDFLSGFGQKNVVLGCTEFPVLVGTIKKSELAKELDDYVFHDPLEIVLKQLKKLLK